MSALLTPRLRLVAPAPEHVDALLEIHRRNAAHFHGRMARVFKKRSDVDGYFKPNPRGERFLITLRTSGEVVGGASISNIDGWPFSNATLGYWLDNAHCGNGYAREAVARLIKHSFTRLKLHRLEANIAPDNRASIRLARALGFRKEGVSLRMLQLGGAWRDQARFALTVDEWKG